MSYEQQGKRLPSQEKYICHLFKSLKLAMFTFNTDNTSSLVNSYLSGTKCDGKYDVDFEPQNLTQRHRHWSAVSFQTLILFTLDNQPNILSVSYSQSNSHHWFLLTTIVTFS